MVNESKYRTIKRRYDKIDLLGDEFDSIMYEISPCDYSDPEYGVYDYFNDIKRELVLNTMHEIGFNVNDDEPTDLGLTIMEELENIIFDIKFNETKKYYDVYTKLKCEK